MRKKFYSMVYFDQPDFEENELDFYMSMDSSEAMLRPLDWYHEIHLDESDYEDNNKYDSEKFISDVVKLIRQAPVDSEIGLPLNIICVNVPVDENTEDVDRIIWNRLVKSAKDCEDLIEDIRQGSVSLWAE